MSGHLELDPAQNTESGLVLTQRHFSMGLNPKPYTSVHFDSPQDASGHPYFLPFLRSMLIGFDFYRYYHYSKTRGDVQCWSQFSRGRVSVSVSR